MRRIIGIDFGLSKVGVAISDPSGIISMPLEVIRYKEQKDLVKSLKKIALEKNVKTLVIGYPLNMNYKEKRLERIIINGLKNLKINKKEPIKYYGS